MNYRGFGGRRPRTVWRSLVDLVLFLIVVSATALLMKQFGLVDVGSGTVDVVDGDSLRLKGVEIRLQGIDAPEYNQTCFDAVGRSYPCGREARRALIGLVKGAEVTCQSLEADRYARALSTCIAKDLDLGREMVASGWAISYREPRYSSAENEAKQSKRGLWAGKFENPAAYRARHRPVQGSAGAIDLDLEGDGAAGQD